MRSIVALLAFGVFVAAGAPVMAADMNPNQLKQQYDEQVKAMKKDAQRMEQAAKIGATAKKSAFVDEKKVEKKVAKKVDKK